MTDRDARKVLTGALVLGALLRAWGLWFGLPHDQARPDESVAVAKALLILQGDPNPHFFHWPSLHLYVLAGIYGVARLALRLAGLSPDVFEFSHYALLGRGYVALAGVLTIPVLYRLAHKVAGPAAASIAATLLAVAPLHVRDSHFAMTDVTMTLLVTVSLHLLLVGVTRFDPAWRLQDRPGIRHGIRTMALAGLVGGLAASTKYSAAAILVAAATAQAWLVWRATGRWRPLLWVPSVVFCLCCLVGFVAATPFSVLDFERFRTDVAFNFTHLSLGHGPALGRGWTHHLRFSLPYGLGVPLFVTGLAGIIPLFWRHPGTALVLSGFAASFYWSVGSGLTVFARYILPLVPLWCFSAAVLIDLATRQIAARLRWRPGLVMACLTTMVGAPSLITSAHMDWLLSRTDTRVLAARWLTARLPPEATLHQTGREYVEVEVSSPGLHVWHFDPATEHFRGATRDMLPQWLVLHESPVIEYTRVPPSIKRLARERYRLIKVFAATRAGSRPEDYDQQDAFFLPLRNLAAVIRPGTTISVYMRHDAPGG